MNRKGNVQHIAEHAVTVDDVEEVFGRPTNPDGKEPTIWPAPSLRLDNDGQVYHGHLGGSFGRPSNDLPSHRLRSPAASRGDRNEQDATGTARAFA